MFEDQLIAALFVTQRDKSSGMSLQVIWLAPGGKYNFFTGKFFEGNCWHAIYGRLDETILFAPSGGIVPLGPMIGWWGTENPDELIIQTFYGADGFFTLYEVNGNAANYEQDTYCQTRYELSHKEQSLTFEVEPVQGNLHICPLERRYQPHIYGARSHCTIEMQLDGRKSTCDWEFDDKNERLVLKDLLVRPTSSRLLPPSVQ